MSTPHPELLALLDAIKDDPEDDAPRLILADWLDDHGDGARAEFIRLQVRLEHQPHGDCSPVVREMRERIQQLENDNRDRWLGSLGRAAICSFRRGLVHLFGLTRHSSPHAVQLLGDEQNYASLRQVLPWIDFVSLAALRPHYLVELAESPLLAGLVGLRIDLGSPSPGMWGSLVRSPNLSRLRSFGGRTITDADLPDLAALPCWPRLRTLDLNRNGLRSSAVETLAAWPQLTSLQTLLLNSNHLDDDGVTALAASPHLEGLTALDLSLNDFGVRGVTALARSSHLSGLTSLHLTGNRLKIPGAAALGTASRLRPRTLGLSKTNLGQAGVEHLVRSPLLAKIEDLDLSQNSLTSSAMPALAQSSLLNRLDRLDLSFNRIRDDGAEALAASPHLNRLRLLYLQGNPLGDGGVQALIDSPYLTNLAILNCDQHRLSKRTRARLHDRFGPS